jgi:hypothetical protein
LDRVYLSHNLRKRKMDVETVIAAFTDHLAVRLRITLYAPILRRGRGRGKMNVSLLDDTRVNYNRNGYNGDKRKGSI